MRQERISKRLYNCKCINYGQIDPKKIEALKKIREKEICSFKELSVFRDNEIKDEQRMKHTQSTAKPMFPPIYHIPIQCATEQSSYSAEKEVNSLTKVAKNNKIKETSDRSEGRRKDKSSYSLPPL